MLDIQVKGNPVIYREAPCESKAFTIYSKADGSTYDEVDGLDDNTLFRVAKEINSCSNTSDKINKFERIVVIGDSLSDSEGRMLKKTSGFLPSAPHYYKGNFTNGNTWVNFISSPRFMNITQVVNKAEGGAVAGSYHKLTPSSSSLPSFLSYPVSWFLAQGGIALC